MDTVGNIFDRLCILEKRISVIRESDNPDWEIITALEQQRAFMLKELGRVLTNIFDDERPADVKKHKIYDADVENNRSSDGILKGLANLRYITSQLWSLEDERRDKCLSDKNRLIAADEVSPTNKKRNDIIDAIDYVVEKSRLIIKIWKAKESE